MRSELKARARVIRVVVETPAAEAPRKLGRIRLAVPVRYRVELAEGTNVWLSEVERHPKGRPW